MIEPAKKPHTLRGWERLMLVKLAKFEVVLFFLRRSKDIIALYVTQTLGSNFCMYSLKRPARLLEG